MIETADRAAADAARAQAAAEAMHAAFSQAGRGTADPAMRRAITEARATADGLTALAGYLTAAANAFSTYLTTIAPGASSERHPQLAGAEALPIDTTEPAAQKGPLGGRFTAGVLERHRFEYEHERRTADYLADQHGANVYARPRDHIDGVSSPDAMVRWHPEDSGSITEFKQPNALSYKSMRRSIWEAARQVADHGGGDVVIDGRKVGMSEQFARHNYQEAVDEAHRKNQPLPSQTHVILADGSMITFREP